MTKAAARAREAREKLAQARMPVDAGRLEVLRRAMELAERDDAVKRHELELKRRAKRAEVEAARIELANLELERQQAVIRAPMDGVITRRDVKVGDVLEPGKPVMEIAARTASASRRTVPSEEVGHLRAGMPARIKLDAYDYQTYGTLEGKVCFISPGLGGRRPAQGGRLHRADRACRGRSGARHAVGRVKLGMAGQAEIVTGRESLLFLLVKKIRMSISLG